MSYTFEELTGYKQSNKWLENLGSNYEYDKQYYNPKTRKFMSKRYADIIITKNKNLHYHNEDEIIFIVPKKDNNKIFIDFLQKFIPDDVYEKTLFPVKNERTIIGKDNENLIKKNIKIINENFNKNDFTIYTNENEIVSKVSILNIIKLYKKLIINDNKKYIIKAEYKIYNDEEVKDFYEDNKNSMPREVLIEMCRKMRKVIHTKIIFLTLDSSSLEELEKKLLFENEDTQGEGSDAISVISTEKPYSISFNELKPSNRQSLKRKYHRRRGGFFSWFNKTNFDLTNLGIFTKEQSIIESKKSFEENTLNYCCIYNSIKYFGLPQYKLDLLTSSINTRFFETRHLQKIADILNIDIVVKHHRNDELKEVRNVYYKTHTKQPEQTIQLANIDEHYIPYISRVYITTFSILNYEKVKHFDRWNNVVAIKSCGNALRKKDDKYYNDSINVVKNLLKNKDECLEKMTTDDICRLSKTNINNEKDKQNLDNYTSLEYDEKTCCKLVNETRGKPYKQEIINNVFFDFEANSVILENDNHDIFRPYCVCWINEIDNTKQSIIETNEDKLVIEFLEELYKKYISFGKVRLIAHNATFDYKFLIKHLTNISEISKSKKMISFSAYYHDLVIIIKCSWLLITAPLSKFLSMFGLSTKKEIMPFDILNINGKIQQRYIHKKEFEKSTDIKDKYNEFIENCVYWNVIDKDGFIDILEYSKNYCMIDCEVLQQGYNKFKDWIIELCDINIDDVFTSAGLAHKYMINQGVYDGVYSLAGVPQLFIQKCVVGGRVMCKDNKKLKVNGIIIDFDTVSLYPSAMYRMNGYLKGVPKVITDDMKQFNILQQKSDGYFVKIRINKVGIHRSFPLLSVIDENGIRNFTNDLVDKIIFVDKITLEDAIEHQKIEFDILDGYYFDNGFNNTIRGVIQHLFDERKKKKQEGNKIEQVYKLIMNSSYGKSILKPIDSEVRYFDDEEEFYDYLYKNYYSIKIGIQLSNVNKFRVKEVKPFNLHYNIPQVGASVLSWSKRIMNEVMCSAEDNKIDIFYQDTDSMHLMANDIEKLEKIYNTKYNKNLIGESLGQFHSDFEISGCKNVVSNNLIALGKKAYIHKLVGINKETGKEQSDYHIRLKGISTESIKYTANHYNCNVFELYEKLYNGDKIQFDLTLGGSNKKIFSVNNDFTTNINSSLSRTIKF